MRCVKRWQFVCVLFAFVRPMLLAQDSASLSVNVVDASGAVVPGARVIIIDTHTGVVHQDDTNTAGRVDFEGLTPSDYTLEVTKQGFNKYQVTSVSLGARARQELHIQLAVMAATGTKVDVVATIDALSTDPTQGAAFNHDFIEDLPLNGRNPDSLILMAPGMSSAQGGTDAGGFNSNGLRSNMNYYTMDGVSVNQPATGGAAGGGGFGGFGGGFPGFGGPPAGAGAGGGIGGASGTSIDALQEMRVQTSSIAPEFGRTPGAQIVMTSRSGSNAYHGSLYDYLRSDEFDANDWFANAGGYGKGTERQDRPGGTFGGPIVKNRTMFFVSAEELWLTAPYTVEADVPDLATRASAPAALQPFLNAFPIANGGELINGAALYHAVLSSPTRWSNESARIDHIINPHMTAFGRFSFTPTSSDNRGSQIAIPNLLTSQASHSDSATIGVENTFSSNFLNDLRLNYSYFDRYSQTVMDNYGGAVPITNSEVFPSGLSTANSSFSLNMIGLAGYSYGGQSRSSQGQANVVDNVSKIYQKHQIKTGVDIRQIRSTNHPNTYSENVSFNGLETTLNTPEYAFLTGQALNAQVTSSVGVVYPTYVNFSAYAQDTWRITKWTTITYGLRWDVNPAPYARYGQQPFAISNDPIAGVTQNSPLYPTNWWDVAPRFGVAYNMREDRGHEMMLRFGIGIFYDTGYGATAGAFNGAPFTDVRTISEVDFPLAANLLAAPPMPPFRPYGQINSASPGLVAPRVYQLNATWEHNYGVGTTFSVGLVGSIGHDLIQTQTQPTYSSAYDIAILTTNGAQSDYDGIQVQLRRRMTARLQLQASYTWSHSIDSASSDMGGGGGFATLMNTGQRGDSDYDIRHNLTVAGTYQLSNFKSGIGRWALGNWFLDFNGFVRTGLPFNLQGVSDCTSGATTTTTSSSGTTTTNGCTMNANSPIGLFALVRPSWNGETIWLTNPNAPGGRELNPDAFVLTGGYTQGNIARNTLRGFAAEQVDLAVRRVFTLTERVRLNVGVEAYNALNHPNFANPSPQQGADLASPQFGLVTQMLNAGPGGAAQLYRAGGPRSMELSFRLQF